ncbi:hypothetical protein ELE36_04545 [Pseudolysobacter antarcticus]|uniref:Cytochrome b561 bacterial/Ni-hydrogenase domain-containing protein n=1 Tax=Pseudolysobacter antarcticus TaxID=2511995 RepID=A0A411HGT5_9GAMM|nr:cytochrome b/b6 domain-containing protein [Pseudolysobacter antarcticus]QBB69699.1 hypothetical protein ELE36_04545 [Pseudolysobacter antarcticus]
MINETPATHSKIWDLPTRIFHWLLVVLIVLQYLSGEFELLSMQWHFWLGYTTLALIVFRVLWGFFGSQSARFSSFVRGPIAAARYAASLFSKNPQRSVGHNPLGGWSVLLMLLCVLAQAVTGLFSSDDVSEAGPLVEHVSAATVRWMTHLHHLNQNILLLLIAVHIVAVLLHWLLGRENLIAAMLSGRKKLPAAVRLRFVGNSIALLLFAISAAAVIALVLWGNRTGG